MAFGRLEQGSAPQPMSDINMTPLIDVMLVLMVIFMITAPLFHPSLKLDLPKVDAAADEPAPQTLALAVDAQGRVYLDGKPVDAATLEAAVARTARLNPEAEVALSSDQRVPYGRVAELIGLLQRHGLNRVGLITQMSAATAAGASGAAAH